MQELFQVSIGLPPLAFGSPAHGDDAGIDGACFAEGCTRATWAYERGVHAGRLFACAAALQDDAASKVEAALMGERLQAS
jgi:hypothetical protein